MQMVFCEPAELAASLGASPHGATLAKGARSEGNSTMSGVQGNSRAWPSEVSRHAPRGGGYSG